MSELEICAAAFFRNKGKDVVTETEFVMTVSLDYRWMSGDDAKKLIAAMVSAGILEKKDGYLRPGRELASELPIAYRPSKNLIGSLGKQPAEEKSVFMIMMELAKNTNLAQGGFAKKCRELSKKTNLPQEVIGILLLRDEGVDVSDLYGMVRETIVSK